MCGCTFFFFSFFKSDYRTRSSTFWDNWLSCNEMRRPISVLCPSIRGNSQKLVLLALYKGNTQGEIASLTMSPRKKKKKKSPPAPQIFQSFLFKCNNGNLWSSDSLQFANRQTRTKKKYIRHDLNCKYAFNLYICNRKKLLSV